MLFCISQFRSDYLESISILEDPCLSCKFHLEMMQIYLLQYSLAQMITALNMNIRSQIRLWGTLD